MGKPSEEEDEEDAAQPCVGNGEAGVLRGILLGKIGARGAHASDTVLLWASLIPFSRSLVGSSEPFRVDEDRLEVLASERGSSDSPRVSVDSLHLPDPSESKTSVEESTTLDRGFRVRRSRDRAKQNSAEARSHKGNLNGVPERKDSRLVQEDKERKLVQTD